MKIKEAELRKSSEAFAASSTDTATDSTKATGTGQQTASTGTDGMSDGWSKWSRVIKAGEGTTGDKGYTTMFTGAQFSDFSKHPELLQRSGNLESDAAGAYQFYLLPTILLPKLLELQTLRLLAKRKLVSILHRKEV